MSNPEPTPGAAETGDQVASASTPQQKSFPWGWAIAIALVIVLGGTFLIAVAGDPYEKYKQTFEVGFRPDGDQALRYASFKTGTGVIRDAEREVVTWLDDFVNTGQHNIVQVQTSYDDEGNLRGANVTYLAPTAPKGDGNRVRLLFISDEHDHLTYPEREEHVLARLDAIRDSPPRYDIKKINFPIGRLTWLTVAEVWYLKP